MLERRPRRRHAVALVLAALLAASCTSSDDDASGPEAEDEEAVTFTGHSPEEIADPPAEGKGVNLPQPAAPLPDGYVAEELFVGGTATSFTAGDPPDDGRWAAQPGEEAEYRTRIVVRRPASADDFSGTVIVEWLNVTAIEASPEWAFTSEEMGREGHAYIAVSAQALGVEGGDPLLDVDVDEEEAEDVGASTDTSGLKNIDPDRYGTLVHPGDAYAYDIYTQVGRAVEESPDLVLGGLEPSKVIAAGESQSAAFMTTLINAVHPLDPVFDGFLVHSRGGGVAPIGGDMATARSEENTDAFRQMGIQIRTDLDVPVFVFETETDLITLGYSSVRQPDSELVRTWEVAGLSHADAHFIRAVIGGPRDPGAGEFLGCTGPINTGPQHEVLQAALHHLVAWVDGGDPPPAGTPIDLTDDDDATIARDDLGIATGGVRHPMVDVPTVVLSGAPPEDGGGGVCFLFGTTTPIPQDTLLELYGDADAYLDAFTASADEAVEAGFLLRPDADALVAEAEANRALFE